MTRIDKAFVTFAVIGFVFGVCIAVGLIQFGFVSYSLDSTTHHWRKVNEYNAYMANPKNYDEKTNGLIGARVPFDPEPSLAALVAANEIEHVDLVLPNVPNNRDSNRYWMDFVDKHQDTIIYSAGNIEYAAFPVEGQSPLHLTLWFRKGGTVVVQQLIKELQNKSRDKDTTVSDP